MKDYNMGLDPNIADVFKDLRKEQRETVRREVARGKVNLGNAIGVLPARSLPTTEGAGNTTRRGLVQVATPGETAADKVVGAADPRVVIAADVAFTSGQMSEADGWFSGDGSGDLLTWFLDRQLVTFGGMVRNTGTPENGDVILTAPEDIRPSVRRHGLLVPPFGEVVQPIYINPDGELLYAGDDTIDISSGAAIILSYRL